MKAYLHWHGNQYRAVAADGTELHANLVPVFLYGLSAIYSRSIGEHDLADYFEQEAEWCTDYTHMPPTPPEIPPDRWIELADGFTRWLAPALDKDP